MRSKLFKEIPKRMQTSRERWVHISPEKDDAYHLYDALQGEFLGRILFDTDDNWIYDGTTLPLNEQEDVAGSIGGHQKEMDKLMRDLFK